LGWLRKVGTLQPLRKNGGRKLLVLRAKKAARFTCEKCRLKGAILTRKKRCARRQRKMPNENHCSRGRKTLRVPPAKSIERQLRSLRTENAARAASEKCRMKTTALAGEKRCAHRPRKVSSENCTSCGLKTLRMPPVKTFFFLQPTPSMIFFFLQSGEVQTNWGLDLYTSLFRGAFSNSVFSVFAKKT
jgi:hypothetical protein